MCVYARIRLQRVVLINENNIEKNIIDKILINL